MLKEQSAADMGRLISKTDLDCKTKREFKVTTNSEYDLTGACNRLDRHFIVNQPNQVYVGDFIAQFLIGAFTQFKWEKRQP